MKIVKKAEERARFSAQSGKIPIITRNYKHELSYKNTFCPRPHNVSKRNRTRSLNLSHMGSNISLLAAEIGVFAPSALREHACNTTFSRHFFG